MPPDARQWHARSTGSACPNWPNAPRALLSGGEQQRLALARVWSMRPQVLFLDEPSSALDPSATRIIEEMVEQFSAEGITIVMTTHYLGQTQRLGQDGPSSIVAG